MIKNLIFDFGNIFINLDLQVVVRELKSITNLEALARIDALNSAFEVGAMSSGEFVEGLRQLFPDRDPEHIRDLWNSMLLDFPEYRLRFLEELAESREYRLFLISNTNALHIPHVISMMGQSRYNRFKNSFEGFYLSHEIGMRKPNREVFEYILRENGLKAATTLFIDDTQEHIESARGLGIQTWHLQVGKEDIIQLNTKLGDDRSGS